MSLEDLAPGKTTTAHPGLKPHLRAGLLQQLPTWPDGLLLVKGDQGVQRGVDLLLPGDYHAPIVQELHHKVAAAVLGSAEARPGLGHPTPLFHPQPTPIPNWQHQSCSLTSLLCKLLYSLAM